MTMVTHKLVEEKFESAYDIDVTLVKIVSDTNELIGRYLVDVEFDGRIPMRSMHDIDLMSFDGDGAIRAEVSLDE